MRRVIFGALAATATCIAMASIGSAAASAGQICEKAWLLEPSSFKFWGSPQCLHAETGKENYILVETPLEEVKTDVYCAKVVAGEPSSWEDAKCTKAKSGGGFALIHFPLWLVNGEGVTATLSVTTKGFLELTDLKVPLFGESTVKCEGTFDGTILNLGEDEITEVLNLKGENVPLICKGVKGACGTASEAATVTPLNLPWQTVLILDLSEKILDVLFKSSATNENEQPGYTVVCKSSGLADSCNGYVGAVLTNNELEKGVTGVFNLKEQEEEEETAGCTQGGAGAGHIEGSGLTLLNEVGLTLTVSEEND